jgi:uncharacterized protein (TIGR00661 family)
MRIVYGVCAWGMGHATRSLPLLRRLVGENHDVLVVSSGSALGILKRELGDSAQYEDMPDYPFPKKTDPVGVMAEMMLSANKYIGAIRKETVALRKILNRIKTDLIVSDNRYGFYSKNIPSYYITHQLRIMNPSGLRILEKGSESFNLFFMRKYWGTLVPDYREDSLSGNLSHDLDVIDEENLEYIGPLSDFGRKDTPKDIDVFITLSGPEKHRASLEESIREQAGAVPEKYNVVMNRGKPGGAVGQELKGVRVHTSLSAKEQETHFNRARLVVSRSGYSTLMDVATVGVKALFVPTPAQPEQEYLGRYHRCRKTFYSVSQDELNLERDCRKALSYGGIGKPVDVRKSVDNAMNVIFSGEKTDWKR